ALVDCEEIGFARRVYSTHTDAAGLFTIAVPRIPLTCDLVPPGSRTDVALTRRVTTFSASEAATLMLEEGTLIEGRVRYEADEALRPLELGVVEVLDSKGQLLGTALTRPGDGSFSVRVTTPAD